jgi:hypothetical protein
LVVDHFSSSWILVLAHDFTFDVDILHRLLVLEESKKGFLCIGITLQILKDWNSFTRTVTPESKDGGSKDNEVNQFSPRKIEEDIVRGLRSGLDKSTLGYT